jgi:predicted peroxiredoxin
VSRLAYLLAHSTAEPERAAVALAAAAAAAEAGHEVALVLTGEGVRLAVAGLVEALGRRGPRPAAESLASLAGRSARIVVSWPCYEARGFGSDVLLPAATLAPLSALAGLVSEGYVPVTV